MLKPQKDQHDTTIQKVLNLLALLGKAEYDLENYADRGRCYRPKISVIFFSLACVAEVILPRLYNNVCEAASRSLFWTTYGLNELPEMRFEFPFILIDQSTMAFLRANHGAYSNPDTLA